MRIVVERSDLGHARGRVTRCRFAWCGSSLALVLGCGTAPCEEDVRAQVIDERVALVVGDTRVEAELADEVVERERGWMHRVCGREALLLVPDAPGELPVWGCGLVEPVDLFWIRDGEVVARDLDLEPCVEPCTGCPIVGEGLVIDAVLESPAGTLTAVTGARVSGWP